MICQIPVCAGICLPAVGGSGIPCVVTSLMTWLVPAFGPERDRLAATIDRLAAEHGAPRFQPHVTMVGTFDSAEDVAIRTLGSLVIGVPSFEVTFAAVGHEQTYFRSLYLRAAPAGTRADGFSEAERAAAKGERR